MVWLVGASLPALTLLGAGVTSKRVSLVRKIQFTLIRVIPFFLVVSFPSHINKVLLYIKIMRMVRNIIDHHRHQSNQ